MYNIFHPKLRICSRNTRAASVSSRRGLLLSALPLHLMQWKLSLKDAKITSDYWQMNNPHISCACHLCVTVWQREWHWRQGKTAFPVFIHPPLEAFESRMNNKWDHDEGGSQSGKMERLKKERRGGGAVCLLFFQNSGEKNPGMEEPVVKMAFMSGSVTLKKS